MTDRIEPALSEGEWRALHARTSREFHAAAPLSVSVLKAHQLGVGEIPGVIAAANDALPESDRRKLTRKHLVALRSVLTQNPDNLPGYGVPLRQLADALDAILPPAANAWEAGSLYGLPPE